MHPQGLPEWLLRDLHLQQPRTRHPSYDLRGRQLLANWNTATTDTAKTYFACGLTKSIDNGVSKSDFTDNARHELTTETQTLSGRPARTVDYSYDADGLRINTGYPSAKAVALAWTSRFQLASVSTDGPPPLATYTYDKAGRNTSIAHENSITESKSYNVAGELLANLHLQGTTPVSGSEYDLDATGRRTASRSVGVSPTSSSYTYDPTNQIVSADYGNSLTDAYAYDSMGNRTTASVVTQDGTNRTYTTNSANQYTSITGFTPISHDANGNLLQQNGVTYTWDSENRLLSVTPSTPALGAKSLVHTYDGSHRRVTRTVREWTAGGWANSETIQFIYDGWNVIEEYALNPVNSVLARTLTWGQDLGGSKSLQAAGGVGGLLLVEEINATATTAFHFQYDGNGNVTNITDLAGDIAAKYRYDAFGNMLSSTGSYAASNRYCFSTKPLDSEVTNAPLYYYGYRYYDPLTGRWPSRDPIKEKGGVNLYGFVKNHGITELDILGLACCKDLKYEEETHCCENGAVVKKVGDNMDGTKCCPLEKMRQEKLIQDRIKQWQGDNPTKGKFPPASFVADLELIAPCASSGFGSMAANTQWFAEWEFDALSWFAGGEVKSIHTWTKRVIKTFF